MNKKYCDYCRSYSHNKCIDNDCELDIKIENKSQPSLYIEGIGVFAVIDINYCPKCGSKLKGSEQNA